MRSRDIILNQNDNNIAPGYKHVSKCCLRTLIIHNVQNIIINHHLHQASNYTFSTQVLPKTFIYKTLNLHDI